MQGKCLHAAFGCPTNAQARTGRCSSSNSLSSSQPAPSPLVQLYSCHRREQAQLQICHTAQLARSVSGRSFISIDNKASSDCTVVAVEGSSRENLIGPVTTAFKDLGIDVEKVCCLVPCLLGRQWQTAKLLTHSRAHRWSLPATARSRTSTLCWCVLQL